MISELIPELEPCEEATPGNRHILLVEDDVDQREALTLQLEGQGFKVLAAANGAAGLNLANEHSPALALLDIGLPDMSGWELCRQIVDDYALSEIPVIALSGNDHERALHRSRASGCRYFVRKPYDPNALLVLIETALRDEQTCDW
jgi:CheY-like chemotaxis protein